MMLWNSALAADDLVSTCQWRHPQFQLGTFLCVSVTRRGLTFENANMRQTTLSEAEMRVLKTEIEHQLRPVKGAATIVGPARAWATATLDAIAAAEEALKHYRQMNPNPVDMDKGKVSPVPVATPPLRRFPAPAVA